METSRDWSGLVKEQLNSLVRQMVEKNILFEDAVREFEKHFIRMVLEKNKGNLSRAAKDLQIHRNTLSRKIATLELDHRPKRRRRRR